MSQALLLLFLGTLSLGLAQSCDTEIILNSRVGLTGETYMDHERAGLTRECIETNVPVEKK